MTVAAVLSSVVALAVIVTSEHLDDKVVRAIFGAAVGWSFIGTGLYAWRRRPQSRIGALMVALGSRGSSLSLVSSAGHGTSLRAEIPLRSAG